MADRTIDRPKVNEDAWRAWLDQRQLSSISPMLDACSRLVIIAPHPDDEVLMAGGLIQGALALGKPLMVLGVTDGAASHGPLPPSGALALARRRTLERELGLHRLGAHASSIRSLGLIDGQVQADQARLTTLLMRHLEAGDLVVCPWRLDGHPDHEACAQATFAARAGRGDVRVLEAPVWMWHWAVPGQCDVDWSLLRRYPLNGHTVQRKAYALDAHASQREPRRDAGPVLDAVLLSRLARGYETFFLGDDNAWS